MEWQEKPIIYLIFSMYVSFNKLWIKFFWNRSITFNILLHMYESNSKGLIPNNQKKEKGNKINNSSC